MEQCANTRALNNYLSGEEQFEKVCESFEYDVRQVIQELRSMSRNYQREYDMMDVLIYILPDILIEELNIKI